MTILSPHVHGPQAWRKSGYWKIHYVLGWQGWSMMILSHVHGPQAWRKSGYWKILQGCGRQMQVGRSGMIRA